MSIRKYTKFPGHPSSRTRNLCNQRFGRLLAIGFAGYNARQQAQWLCKCDCGAWPIIAADSLRTNRTHTESCGCLQSDITRLRSTTHGHAPRKRQSTEYESYCGAKARCTNPDHHAYRLYGGRGIEFRFTSFEEFYAELGPKPSSGHSVDRIDNDGHYEQGNVRWATQKEQCKNVRHNRHFTWNGRTQMADEWGAEMGLDGRTIIARIDRYGFCVECALTRPKSNRIPCPH